MLRSTRTPGGHRRITAGALIEFLNARQMPVPRELDHLSRRRVLLVDDEPGVRHTFELVARAHTDRIELRTTDNGVDALIIVGSYKPHLVILDYVMPGLDGLEVCRRILASPDAGDTRVALLTGAPNAEAEHLEKRALEAGAVAFLAKPLAFADVMALLEPTFRLRPL
jgi:CheY-like chemotaxis protein